MSNHVVDLSYATSLRRYLRRIRVSAPAKTGG
jgi:hypothetical protein